MLLDGGRRVFKGHSLAVRVGRSGAMFLHTAGGGGGCLWAPLLGAPRGADMDNGQQEVQGRQGAFGRRARSELR